MRRVPARSQKVNTVPRELSERAKALIYVFTTFLVQFGNFVVVPLFWRKLDPGDYGVIAVTEIIGAVLMTVTSLSLEQSINRFYYQWPEADRRRKVGTLWVLSWACIAVNAGIVTYLTFLGAPALFPGIPFAPAILVGLIGGTLSCFPVVTFILIRIRRMALLYMGWSLFAFVMKTGTSIYMVLVLDEGLLGYLWGNVLSGTVLLAASVVLMSRFARPNLRFRSVSEEIRYALPLVSSLFVQTLSGVADRYVLQLFASIETLGIYAVSLKFSGLITGLHEALKLSYGPQLMKAVAEDYEGAKRLIVSVVPAYVLPLFAMTVVVALFIRPFVVFVGNPEYYGTADVVPFLMLATTIGVLNIYYSPGLFIARRTSLVFVPSLVAFLCNAGLALLLVRDFQVPGLLAARITAGFAVFFSNLYLSARVYPLDHAWGRLFAMFGWAASAVIVSTALSPGNGAGFSLGLFVALGVAYAVSFAFVYRGAMRALPQPGGIR